MQAYNIINYVHIVDLSILNYIDYLELIEETYQINDEGQLHLNLTGKNKKILTGLILNNINDHIQYGKQNIIINTCKPMQNWRQSLRGNAVRAYKYKFIDNSISVDLIKFNQFVDDLFEKLPTLNVKKITNHLLSEDRLLSFNFQNKLKCIEVDNLDSNDLETVLNKLLIQLGSVNFNTINYNNIIIIDGNHEYAHGSSCPGDIEETVRRNLLEKGIL